jgi:hypothetical protein
MEMNASYAANYGIINSSSMQVLSFRFSDAGRVLKHENT